MLVLKALVFGSALLQSAPQTDPYRLPIGRNGEISISPGEIRSTKSGEIVSLDSIAAMARGHRFVYVGESHDQLDHHKFQADVIQSLVKDGRDVIVGFEMFTRPVQDMLNGWTLGWWGEAEFIEKSDWKKQWGFDFSLYKPIFDVVREHKLPMAALNIPRDWVRKVGRGGPGALSAEEQAQVAPIDLTNTEHRSVFNALMGGHPPMGTQGENIYAGQVLWDVSMADSALKYWDSAPRTSKSVLVIVAGIGHTMYGQGINYRIWKRTGEKGLNVAAVSSDDKIEVSRGLADVVACFKPMTK